MDWFVSEEVRFNSYDFARFDDILYAWEPSY